MSLPVRIVVSQKFDVPAECVFDAWIDPAWIGCWMAGRDTSDERIVRLGVEPRVGGKFSFVTNRPGVEIDYVGKYLELDRPQLLVFTWGTGDALPGTSRVILEILELDHGCELTLSHVMSASDGASSDQTASFWRRKLEALAQAFNPTKTLTLNPS